jgi:hypothetical protein
MQARLWPQVRDGAEAAPHHEGLMVIARLVAAIKNARSKPGIFIN